MTEHTPPLSGLLVIDKPLGVSSMGVCRLVRGRLVAGGAPKRVKVGHGGTLDPLATGVLVVMVGKATRFCERVMGGAKTYETTIDLSRVSDSQDLEQPTTRVAVSTPPSLESVRAAVARFVGVIEQTPPAYSAIKVGGRRAYQTARRGEAPAIQPRSVRVDAIEVLSYAWPEVTIEIRCGRGFYVRSLARDLGDALNAGGVLTMLRRTRVGAFEISRARTFENLPDPLRAADLDEPPAQLLDA